MAKTKVNYTPEQTQALIAEYTSGKSVAEISSATGRAVRSVISKLVREGVYIPAEKPTASKRDEGPTKKEMLRTLEGIAPFSVDGFANATKEAIQALIDLLSEKDSDELGDDQDESGVDSEAA